MTNKIKEVYKLLGIEIGDTVIIDDYPATYSVTAQGLKECHGGVADFALAEVILGRATFRVEKAKKPELRMDGRTLYCGGTEIGKVCGIEVEQIATLSEIDNGKEVRNVYIAKMELSPEAAKEVLK